MEKSSIAHSVQKSRDGIMGFRAVALAHYLYDLHWHI
jgi:hypothetical protein